MSGVSLDQMLPPSLKWRPGEKKYWAALPNPAETDHNKALALRREAERTAGPHRVKMLDLARRLDGPHVPNSMAFQRYQYPLKDTVMGQLWRFVSELDEPVRFFTSIPRGGEVTTEQLKSFDPLLFREQLRYGFNASAAKGSTGIVFAVLEAEYQLATGLWRFHWHGIASGEKLAALENMRELKAFASPRRLPGQPKAEVAYRIKISRQPLYHQPKPFTYLIKPWYARWANPDGKRGPRQRIPDHALAASQLWLDQWSLDDLTLKMGMRCHLNGFTLLNPTRVLKQ